MRYQDGYTLPSSTSRAYASKRRKRAGFRCITVVLHRAQIGALVHRGLLPDAERSDRAAIRRALEGFLHTALMPKTAVLIDLYSKPLFHKS
jgi:hypothetical protein